MLRLALAILLVVGCSATPPPPTSAPTASPPPTPTRAPAPSPSSSPSVKPTPTTTPAPRVTFEDGTYLVPGDLAPGVYRTLAYTDDCYWVRFSGFNSGLADWVASRVGSGYQVVEIAADDAGFDSESCGTWTNDLSPVLESRTEFSAGTYLVGTDIEPGTYVASEAENCYWARLSGLGGTEEETLEEALLDAGDEARVTIEASDTGFTSNGCGTWVLAP